MGAMILRAGVSVPLHTRRVLWLATGTSFRRFAVSSWKGWRDTPP